MNPEHISPGETKITPPIGREKMQQIGEEGREIGLGKNYFIRV